MPPSTLDSDGDELMPDVAAGAAAASASASASALAHHASADESDGDDTPDAASLGLSPSAFGLDGYDEIRDGLYSQGEDDNDDGDDDDDDNDNDDDDDEGDDYYPDEATLGINLRAMVSFFSDFNDRFKTLLASIKPGSDPSEQLSALEELAGLLSISQEESLMGQFPTHAFVREFVRILGGSPAPLARDDPESDHEEEDPETAAFLGAISEGTKGERQVLACRCLANLIEAMPHAARTVVQYGGVDAMVARLVEIELIDLAEQVLQTLEKISIDHPSAIVKAGGLMAVLLYLDFFNLHVQRTAVTTFANCCRKLQESDVDKVRDTIPHLSTLLGYSDRRIQEQTCKSVVRILENYRNSPRLLAQLVTPQLCAALEKVLVPPMPDADDSSTAAAPVANIPNAMVTDLVRALTYATRTSSDVSNHLLESNLGDALFAILTGSRAPTSDAVVPPSGAGKMTLIRNLSTRPKEQVQEALSLTLALLPNPNKAGVFDSRSYTEKAFKRITGEQTEELAIAAEKSQVAKAAPTEIDAEKAKSVLALCKLMLPALVEIHSASVTPTVRYTAIAAILKIFAFANSSQLAELLAPAAVPTFLAGVLSSDDGPALVQGSLQIVELLIVKLGKSYTRALEREGVMWEIKQLAGEELSGEPGPVYHAFKEERRAKTNAKGAPHLTPVQQKDMNIVRARVIQALYAHSAEEQAGVLRSAESLASRVRTDALSSVEHARSALHAVFQAVTSENEGLAGWELLQSGLIDALLIFIGDSASSLSRTERKELFAQAVAENPIGAERLVQRLQENVSRCESVEVASLSGALDEEMRRTPGLALTKQMRIKLVSSDPDVPRSCQTMVIGIHAVAPVSALDEFLRSKIQVAQSVASGGGGNRLSSVLAAFAAAAGAPPPTSGDATSVRPTPSTSSPALAGADDVAARREAAARALMQGLIGGSFDDMPENEVAEAEVEAEVEPEAQEHVEEQDGDAHESKERAELESSTAEDGLAAAGPSSRPAEPARSASYSDALQNSLNTDEWHIVFSVGERDLQMDETVFGVVYRAEREKDPKWQPGRTLWNTAYPLSFRKVKGPIPKRDSAREKDEVTADQDVFPPASDMGRALILLHALYEASTLHAHTLEAEGQEFDSLFVNNKLTAKLNRQLEEPLLAASHVLPLWAQELPRAYPFLFPFSTRFAYLQATAFGSTRLVARWQTLLRSAGDSTSRAREDAFGYLGRLSRQKVRIGRDKLMESVVKICDSYANAGSMLEVEYFDEVGTGLGPTLEFYSLASRAFARTDTGMWLGSERESGDDEYVRAPQGLFPSPVSLSTDAQATPAGTEKASLFRALGTFVAKSLLDSRIIHIDFNSVFMALVVGRPVAHTVRTVAQIDSGLARSLDKVLSMPPESIESLGLDFTMPGQESLELVPGGKEKPVTGSNVQAYVDEVEDVLLGRGTAPLVAAFREGFQKLMDPRALASFTPSELVELFGNAPEDWSRATLAMHVKPDHGFTAESEAYKNFLELMASFDGTERRLFLQWLTGSPKLPIGGFKALQPPLTVVRRPHEAPLQPDDYLPSVMTCVNYLKLPNYSSKGVMGQRVHKAMLEGGKSFHLS